MFTSCKFRIGSADTFVCLDVCSALWNLHDCSDGGTARLSVHCCFYIHGCVPLALNLSATGLHMTCVIGLKIGQ